MIDKLNYFKWNKVLLFINIGLIVLFGIIFFYHIKIISKTKLPPRFEKVLKQYENYYITSIMLCKQEVSIFVRNVFDIVTQGQIRDKYFELDKARHPYLILTIVDNIDNPTIEKKLLLEKKEITVIRELKDKEYKQKTDPNNPQLETNCYGYINGIPNLTVKEFVQKTLDEMKEEFFIYGCKDKQCGYFLKRSIIDTNLVPDSEKELVIKYLELDKYNELLKDYPKTQKIIDALSNILKYREYLLYSENME
jgi:hypothetical protein